MVALFGCGRRIAGCAAGRPQGGAHDGRATAAAARPYPGHFAVVNTHPYGVPPAAPANAFPARSVTAPPGSETV